MTNVIIVPSPGDFTFTGHTPALSGIGGSSLTITPAPGSFTFSGNQPEVIGAEAHYTPAPPPFVPTPPLPPSNLPPLVIPLRAVPSQTVSVTLNNQPCQINVRQTSTGVFLDLFVNDALIVGGVLCQNLNAIVRSPYLGFIGDLAFYDTQPSTLLGPSDPVWTGLGSRFPLEYFMDAP